ncbi:MAG: RHS repeat-associated core domain-containing protein [Candidatus Acidiferrales bacterium]
MNYTNEGQEQRVSKVGSKLYWYGAGSEILAETDASGNTTAEYIFFGGKRVAMLPAGSTAQFYVEDSLGTSRIVTTNTGVVCYDADFYPYGGERPYINSCTQNNYKFEGKERDVETSIGPGNTNGNDDFGARYYSNRFGRWLSADWSNVPVPVPYANLTNPQTLNLYAMVADDPESFADLDGHIATFMYQLANPEAGAWDPSIAEAMSDQYGLTREEFNLLMGVEPASQQPAPTQAQNPLQQVVSAVNGIINTLPNGQAVSGAEISKQINDAAKSSGGLSPEAQQIVSNMSTVTKNVETKKKGKEPETTINIVNKAKQLDISVAKGVNVHAGQTMSFRYSSSGGTITWDKFNGFGITLAGMPLVEGVRIGPNGIQARVGVSIIAKWVDVSTGQ